MTGRRMSLADWDVCLREYKVWLDEQRNRPRCVILSRGMLAWYRDNGWLRERDYD